MLSWIWSALVFISRIAPWAFRHTEWAVVSGLFVMSAIFTMQIWGNRQRMWEMSEELFYRKLLEAVTGSLIFGLVWMLFPYLVMVAGWVFLLGLPFIVPGVVVWLHTRREMITKTIVSKLEGTKTTNG